MDWSSDHIQSMFGRIIGDPTHRLECIWVAENGSCCRNTVSKDSRRNGAICLKTFQELLAGDSPTLRLSKAASYMLCAECRSHSSRARKCAQQWMNLLHAQASHVERTTPIQQHDYNYDPSAYRWPTGMSYGIGRTECLLSAPLFCHVTHDKFS